MLTHYNKGCLRLPKVTSETMQPDLYRGFMKARFISGMTLVAAMVVIAASQIPPRAAETVPSLADGQTAAAFANSEANQVELGRLLFWDPILSGSKDVACASCHHPDFAYADGRDLSLGAGSVGLGPNRTSISNGQIPVVKRNSPTILNTAFNGLDDNGRRGRRNGNVLNVGDSFAGVNQTRAPMFWDSRVRSLEAQALEPLKMLEEMRGNAYPEAVALDSVVARLQAIPEYVTLFRSVFGLETTINATQLGQAIAAFERSLVAVNSPFDRFRAGDQTALTPQQQRGMEAFEDANCDECHDGLMFSDFDLHAEGVAENPALAEPDAGAGRFRFRTPSLRNVALTAPYMHNGMLPTLEDVLRFYDAGRSENPNVINGGGRGGRNGNDRDQDGNNLARLDNDFRQVDDMSEQEMQDIVAFLNALTDTNFDRTIPARVPSGLTPGGGIQIAAR
jgi:cytochrome c peroxidase